MPAMITVEQARERVRKMAASTDEFGYVDPETAHVEEDAIRHEVLEAIAAGSPDAAELARIALSTSGIQFKRWCS